MHVLVASDHLPPHRSGHAVAVGWWIAALSEAGLRVTVVGDAPPPAPLPDGCRWFRPARLPGVPLGHPLAGLRPAGSLWSTLRRDPPEVLAVHGYGPLMRQLWGAFPHLPMVLSIHQFPAGSGAPAIPGLRALMDRWLQAALLRAAVVTVPSQRAAEQLAEGWGRRGVVLPTGVALPFEARLTRRAESPEGGSSGRLHFLYLGRRTHDKNFLQFVRLANAHPQHRWSALGHGPIDPTEAVRALPSGGAVEVVAALDDADALLSPGLHETQGLAVLEALHRGVAVAAPAATAQAEMLREGDSGALYPAGDDVAALAALERAAELTRTHRVVVPAGYRRSELTASMIQLLQGAAAPPPPG